MTTAAPTITFRKTRTGEWVAFGPTKQIKVGTVQITRRDGSVVEHEVIRTGKGFQVDGVYHRYGYLDPYAKPRTIKQATAPAVKPATPAPAPKVETTTTTTPAQTVTRIRRPEVGTSCDACGKRGFRAGLHLAADMSGILGTACNACDDGLLSYQ